MYKFVRFAPLLLLMALLGCGGGTGGGGSGSAPQITSFTANPGSITAAGQAVTLSWTVTSGVTGLEIDQGVGPVSGTSTVVYPAGPTTYTLTASNSSGSDDATAEVTLGTGGGPLVEDGLPPSGIFGVSLTPSDFQSDQTGEISSPSDERIVRVAPGGSFYALVSYSDPGGVAGVNIFIANSSPPGLKADLVLGQEVGGFTLVGEVGGCVLDGTQTTVNCIYQIQVGDIPNITALPGAGSEFAYVFRTRVTDVAGNVSDTPPRGYVIVGASSGGGDGGGGGGGGDGGGGDGGGGGGGGTPANRNPSAAFTNTQTTSDSTGVSYRFSAAGSTDPDGDTLSYAWTFGDGTGASSRDHTKKYTRDGNFTVSLTVSDGKGGSDTETKTVAVDVPGGGGGGGTPTPTNFTLTVTKAGNGNGTVTGTGINCGTDCTQSYASSTKVELKAVAASGSTFAGWGGACSGTGSCSVTMNSAKTVTATFNPTSTTPNNFTLTVAKSGNGSGLVTSAPGGISCGDDCAGDYASGTDVTLTAAAANGSTFAGWSGGGCSGTGACTVDITANTTVTANFTAPQVLRADAGPNGVGTVGQSVPLNGSASTGATSYSWTFKSTPAGNTAKIRNITRPSASFTPNVAGPYTVTLTVGNGITTDTDEVTIDVSNAPTPAPNADAGDDRTTTINVPTMLDGTGSENAASYSWQVTTTQPGSTPTLATPTGETTTFTTDVVGNYVVTLTVRDGSGARPDTDIVEIKVNP